MRERSDLWRPKRRRFKRWVESIDPWIPRPADSVAVAFLFLILALLHVGLRSHAVELNRRLFHLEEEILCVRDRTDVLASRVTMLADRARVLDIAKRELGMVVPGPQAFAYIYYVEPRRSRVRIAAF